MKKLDQYRGCLIGGAAGDALGYAVEFHSHSDIICQYGPQGITEYELCGGVAEISDDTQMTLFTATGLLTAAASGMAQGIMGGYPSAINYSYGDWYRTQTERYPLDGERHYSWLVNVPELFHCQAPGNTCLSAIESPAFGTIEQPINDSKGCGGVMRVAPIGLYFDGTLCSLEEIDRIGAEAAALTHGHPLGYIPAAALVHIIHLLVHKGRTLRDAVSDMQCSIRQQFAQTAYVQDFLEQMDRAVALSQTDTSDLEAIQQLGEGWVAEETLAIAVYCALKYEDDFDRALIASVNHSGDSDSTGAVTGNILGAYLGLEGIPRKYLDNLELREVILEVAVDLCRECRMTEYGGSCDGVWDEKYVKMTYKPSKR